MRSVAWWAFLGGVLFACGGKSISSSPSEDPDGESNSDGGSSRGASGGIGGTGSGASGNTGTGASGGTTPRGGTGGGARGGTGAVSAGARGGTGAVATGAVGSGATATGARGGSLSIGGAPFAGQGGTSAVGGVPTATGGTGDVAGAGGSDDCSGEVFLPNWQQSTRPAAEELAVVQKYIAGNWEGTSTNPWNGAHRVGIYFSADGGYSAHCYGCGGDECMTFYYGTESAHCELMRYSIDVYYAATGASGLINVPFGSDAACYLPGWQGELSHVEIDGSLDRMRLDFYRSDGYGPVHLELRRIVK